MFNDKSQFNYCYYFVNLYLKNIGPLEFLTSEQERRLLNKHKKGDREAFEELVIKSQYIVIEEILYFTDKGVELLDLIQYANLAMISLLYRYTNDKGPLKNYLHRNIYRYLENNVPEFYSIICYPANILSDIKKTANNYYKNSYGNYTINELFNENNLLNVYYDTLKISTRMEIGLDNVIDLSDNYIDIGLLRNSLKVDISYLLSTLKKRESQIIKMYFGIDENESMSLSEIGHVFNITRERVRQIKEIAIKKLQHISRSKILIGYLDIFDSEPVFTSTDDNFEYYYQNENESKAIELLKKYIESRRRRTAYPNISNMAELCRKLLKNFLEKEGKPCSYNVLKKYIYDCLPLLKAGSFEYALSSSEDIINLHKGFYALKKWMSYDGVDKSINNEMIKDSENKKLNLDSSILNKLDLSYSQLNLIELFFKNNGKLSNLKITVFSRNNKYAYNQILNSINKKFIEKYNEPLIIEKNSNFILNDNFIF